MGRILHPLLSLLASVTRQELARQVAYLKEENRMLRARLPERLVATDQEKRRRLRCGRKLGLQLKELISIVSYQSFRLWVRETEEAHAAKKAPTPKRKPGRPRTPDDIRELVLKLARENSWGYTRIMGELKKLGITPPSRNTIKNILKEHGLDPGPKRGEGTWDEFLTQHAKTLWRCDFYAKSALTMQGIRDLYVLVFLHVETRRVFLSPSTEHPNEAWVKEQAAAFTKHVQQEKLGAAIVMHDRDTKFTAGFDAALKTNGLQVLKTAFRSPNTCAFVERFIQTLGQECLDYFVVFGARHLDYLCAVFVEHYHRHRSHQGKDNELLVRPNSKRKTRSAAFPATLKLTDLRCETHLGGLLRHYYRKAA